MLMETMKKSEQVFNLAVDLETFLNVKKEAIPEEMKLKIQEKIKYLL